MAEPSATVDDDKSKPDFNVEGEDPEQFGAEITAEGTAEEEAVEKQEKPAAAVVEDPAALAAVAGEDDGRGLPARFSRVNAKLAETLQENERLKGELQGVRSVVQPAAATKAVDVDALEDKIYDALQLGDKDTALKLRREVNAELRRQAEEVADQRAAKAVTLSRQEAIAAELNEVAAAMQADHPVFDRDSDEYDEGAVAQVIALRDVNISKGMRPGKALEAAVKKVVPLYETAADVPAETPQADDLGKRRQQAALEKAGRTSMAQPAPLAGGVGARSGASVVNAKNLTDSQLREVDKKKMFAGEFD